MTTHQRRLTLQDNHITASIKLCGGNPGAMSVCSSLLRIGSTLDPQALMGSYSAFMNLDMIGVYEDRIWMLYKDVCGSNIVKTFAALRAVQLGIVSAEDLNFAIDNRGSLPNNQGTLNVDTMLAEVKKRLTKFARVD